MPVSKSANTVTPLRERMIADMAARKLSPASQRSHITSCKRFAAWLCVCPTRQPLTMLSLSHGRGLRAGEVMRLKAGDIDSAKRSIRIVQAKGAQ